MAAPVVTSQLPRLAIAAPRGCAGNRAILSCRTKVKQGVFQSGLQKRQSAHHAAAFQRDSRGVGPRSWRASASDGASSESFDGGEEGGDDYDPNDLAVSDEPVPDDILETLAAGPPIPVTSEPPEFAALGVPSGPPEGFFATEGEAEEGVGDAEMEERRRDLKLAVLDSVFGLERGIRASSEGRAEIAELISQLEACNPEPCPTEAAELLGGRWVLAYTSFSELLPLLAVSLIPLVKVGEIVQTVDTDSAILINSVTFIGPFTSTTLEASAAYEVRSPKRLQIKFQEGSISAPKVGDSTDSSGDLPSSLDLFGQTVDLSVLTQSLGPLKEVTASVARSLSGLPPLKFQLGQGGAQSWLLTTYLDEDLRISRGDGGGLFVLVKEGSPFQ